MPQADFAYDTPAHGARLPVAVTVLADRPHLRAQVIDDARAAGLRVTASGELAGVLEGEARPLGDVVLVDCPQATGAGLAALARLDQRAARTGAQVVVSTTLDALDDVFACMDQSAPQILVDPGRGERAIALGRALAALPDLGVRELSPGDRLTLLRLSEQVSRIAERLERIEGAPGRDPAPAVESPALSFSQPDGREELLVRRPAPPLPDPQVVRRIIRQRQARARYFDGGLFSDPAWDMLLDLTAARAEKARVSVTSLCIASGVPATTALRWIGQMTEAGLFRRIEDEADRRRAFIALTDHAAEAMARYFADCVPSLPA